MSKIKVETHTMGPRFSETVLSELDMNYSRRVVPLAATTDDLTFGTVLAAGTGGYAPYKAAADTKPVAILLEDVAHSTKTQDALVLTG